MRNDTQLCGVESRRAQLNQAVFGEGGGLSFSQSESLEETEVNDPELGDRSLSRVKIDLYSSNISQLTYLTTPLTKTIISDTKATLVRDHIHIHL